MTPQIGETINKEQFNQLYPVGTTLSGEEFSKYGETEQPQQQTGKINFLERLKLGFGGKEAKAKQQQLEKESGLKGKFDIGDIADVAGASLPIIGSIIGAPLGGMVGSATGAAGGQALRRGIGAVIGADQPKVEEVVKDVAYTGIGTYVGGKILGGLFNVIAKVIPNKFMATIFKQSADDIKLEVKTGGKNLVQSQKILEEGLKGNARSMMETSLNTMKDMEQQAQGLVKGKLINIPEKKTIINTISNYIKSLKPLAKQYGFEPEILKEGKTIINGLKSSKGNNVIGEVVLQARRFIDNVRRTSSFKTNPDLSPLESVYKNRADYLRTMLSKQVDGLGEVMKRYKVHIDAFEDLAKYAAKSQNKDLFDLIDVFIMYGIDPTAYLARRGLSSATFKSYTAQGLYQGGKLLDKFLPKGVVPTTATRGILDFLNK
jgi:hypothetical protein